MLNQLRFSKLFGRRPEGPMDEIPRPNAGGITETSGPGADEILAPPKQQKSSAEEYYDAITQARGDSPINDKYKDLLLHGAPSRAASQPSVWRRLAAASAGAAQGYTGDVRGGIQTAEDINERPYNNRMSEYMNRVRTTGVGAEIERKSIDDKVDAMTKAQQLGMTYAEMKERQRHNLAGEDVADRNADTAANKANKPSYKPTMQTMTGVWMVNEANPEDRHFLPGETIASVNANTQQGMLGVARQNAGTNARRANIYESAVNNENSNRDANTGIARSRADAATKRADALSKKGIPPAAQKTAEEMALRDMFRDPRTRKFMQESSPGFPDFNGQIDDETHQRLSNILNEKMAGYLGLSPEDLDEYAADDTVDEDPN
jgi:hypothetical protein